MNTRLRIKNYKRINEEIQIQNLDKVNYFVGKNSSGKSSILNAISHLNDGSNSRRFFNENSLVELTINDLKQAIIWESKDKNPNHTSHVGNLKLIIIIPDENNSEKGANGIQKRKFNYANIYKESLEYLNETAGIIGISPITAKRIINNDDPWDTTVGNRIFLQKEKEILLAHLADGLKSFNNLRYSITKAFNDLKPSEIEQAHSILIILEEPENNLHPDLQKRIPELLNNFLINIDSEINSKVCFCVSTHSPFIIGASSEYESQKVYLLNEGNLVDLALDKVEESSGYNGFKCAWIVGQMLGADVTDFGYPVNYCILEEYSLQLILQNLQQKGIIKNIQFVSASGISRTVSLAKTINEIENLNTLVKCNPYYTDKYCLIIDSMSDLSSKEKKRFEKIKEKLESRFIELSKHSLEDFYEEFNEGIFVDYQNEIKTVEGRKKGHIKAKYSEKIADFVNSKEDFSKLFKNELDFLLKD